MPDRPLTKSPTCINADGQTCQSNCIHAQTDYVETLNSIRHYSNVRFAALTVYLAGTSGILIAITQAKDDAVVHIPPVLIMTCGLIITLVFWCMDVLVS